MKSGMKSRMKNTFFAFCILSVTAAFAQAGGASAMGMEGPSYQFSSHPQHADIVPLAQEQNILAPSNYFVVHGERPASDFPQIENENQKKTVIALGTAAREIRRQHAEQRKSQFVWVN